jgi:hypothetical protein
LNQSPISVISYKFSGIFLDIKVSFSQGKQSATYYSVDFLVISIEIAHLTSVLKPGVEKRVYRRGN